jgi:hypothetical protein
MSSRVKTVLAVFGIVFIVLIVLHIVAAPMMASVAHYVHGR